MVSVPSSCFSTASGTRDLFLGATHRKVLHSLVQKVLYGTQFIAVTGEPGVGKTVLLKAAREILAREDLHVLDPATAPIRSAELHETIVNALEPGIPPIGVDNVWHLEGDGSRFVLSIDNAQALTANVLRYLWLILQQRVTLTYSRLQIIFVGLPQFWSLLEEDVLSPLREHILRLELPSLSRAEVRQYLNHCLDLHGCPRTWRSGRDLRYLMNYAGTTPREINGFAAHLLSSGWPYFNGQGRRPEQLIAELPASSGPVPKAPDLIVKEPEPNC